MNAVDIFVALRRRWRIIAVVVAAVVAIAWITTPAGKKGAKGTATWSADQMIYVDGVRGGTALDRIASYVATGTVPNNVAKQLGSKAIGGGAGAAAAKGSSEHVTIGSTSCTAKPIGAVSALDITCTDKKGTQAREVVDRLTVQLQAFMKSSLQQQYQANIDTLTQHFNDLGHQVSDAIAAEANCGKKDSGCRIRAHATYVDVHNAWLDAHKLLNKARAQVRTNILLRPSNTTATGKPLAVISRKVHASTSTIPVATKPRLALGFVVGLLLGALLAFLVGKLDSSVYGVQGTETAGRLPVLAEIPHVSTSRRRRFEVLTQLSPLSGVADAYRGLRTSIGLIWLANESQTGRTEPRTLIIASPGPNEGKSTTSANLAAAYAEMGKRVTVVDLDFRRQRLHKFLGANAEPHLANIGTLSEPRVDLEAITQSTSIPGVRFIGSAAPDSTPAEAAVAGRAAIMAAQETSDIVIIDTPPLLLTNDTFDLLDFADAVLLLVRDGRTKTTALTRASQQLRRLDAPVLGIALIGAVSSRPGYGYGYGYGYRYGYSYGGYGYGYGARTGLDKSGRGPDIDLTDTPEPVVALSEPAAKPRRFGVRRSSDRNAGDDTQS